MAGDLTSEELQELIAETGLELDAEQLRMLLAYLRTTDDPSEALGALERLQEQHGSRPDSAAA